MSALDLACSEWSPAREPAIDFVRLAFQLSNLGGCDFERVGYELDYALIVDDKVAAIRTLGFGEAAS